MAKKKKVVDLKPTSVTEKELSGLQSAVNALNRAQMEIGNFSLGNSEIGNCSYENPHVSLSNGDELSFCLHSSY